MGKSQKTIIKISKSKRIRKDSKKETCSTSSSNFEKVLKKAQKEGLSTLDINKILGPTSNFLGVFACDKIPLIRDSLHPTFLVINTDKSNSPGSHWILFRLDSRSLEIYDSLGFCDKRWIKFPKPLTNFLLRYRHTHKLLAIPRLQSDNSSTCGLFAVYFCLSRQKISFTECLQKFSSDLLQNEIILSEEIKKLL